MAYTRVNFEDLPSTNTPINATNLNKMDVGISNLDSGKQDKVSAKGSTTKPVYTSANGTFSECSTYAGGTAVTLNGTSKAGSTASMYAPTGAGTSGQVLKSNGSGAPSWVNQSSLIADTYSTTETRIGTWTDGKPLYRKVVQTNNPTSTGNWQTVATITNLSNVIDIRGYRRISDYELALIFPIYDIYWNISAKTIYIKSNADYDNNRTKYVIIEYTKTS